MRINIRKIFYGAALGLATLPGISLAGGSDMYAVTITNITRGETFTPILVVSHKSGQPLYTLGAPASPELVAVAESGDISPMHMKLMDSGMAFDAASSGGLLAPGESVTVNVKTKENFDYISVVSMLIPTNDAFFAVNGVKAPEDKRTKSIMSPAYDAGSEINDELCAHIPGPVCGGEALSVEDGEGYVHIHGGIHGIGDLEAASYDWRNPVAKISIKRVK
jgi:hypothetical protein